MVLQTCCKAWLLHPYRESLVQALRVRFDHPLGQRTARDEAAGS